MAKTTSQDNSNTCYLRIYEGKFYETTKDPEKPGFVKHEYEVAGEKGVSLRRYYDDVSGIIKNIGLYKDRFNPGNYVFTINLQDGEDNPPDVIQIPWFTKKRSIHPYAKNLITRFENLKFDGLPVTLSPFAFNATEDDGTEKFRIGISVRNSSDEKIKGVFHEDMPQPETTQNEVGEDVQTFTEQNKFFYALLQGVIERFKASNGTPNELKPKDNVESATNEAQDPEEAPAPKKETQVAATKKEAPKKEAPTPESPTTDNIEDDDLPF